MTDTFTNKAPTSSGFYPVIWPKANLLLVAHIPDGFDPKHPVVSTTTWGGVWSVDEMTRIGVLWGERLAIEVPSGVSLSKVRSRTTREDRSDTELDQTPVVDDKVAEKMPVVEKKKRAPRASKKKKDAEPFLDQLL